MARSRSSEEVPLSLPEEELLLALAADSILSGLGGAGPISPDLAQLPERVRRPQGAFVTLHVGGELNGCIGTIEPEAALAITVARVAWEAAFDDRRFPALRRTDLPETDIEISVLSPLEPVPAATRDELLAQLRPGVDGLLIDAGTAHATFLPAVWEHCGAPEEFLGRLMLKAGLRPDRWPDDLRAFRYTAFEFHSPVAPGD